MTLPKKFGLKRWIEEGDAAGDPPHPQTLLGERTYWWGVPSVPKIRSGARVYVVYDGRLIGYSHLVEIRQWMGKPRAYLIHGGGAVAVTIDEPIRGFQGYRYRWWDHDQEKPFPDWKKLADD